MNELRNGRRLAAVLLGCCLGISGGRLAAQSNSVPNPEFTGTGGIVVGAVNLLSGFVPDQWRAFAVGGGAAEIEVMPVAADEVCSGCPALPSVKRRLCHSRNARAILAGRFSFVGGLVPGYLKMQP